MPRLTTCPDDQQFQNALKGLATPGDIADVAAHIEDCPTCSERFEQSLAEDTIVLALRDQVTVSDVPNNPAVSPLVERLIRLRPKSDTQESGTDATVCMSTAGLAAPSRPDDCAFLEPAQATDEIGRLGSYRVLKVLGSGGMGMVFQAEDIHLKRKVALKVMKPQVASLPTAKERFIREAQATAQIEHENIVVIHQVGEASGVAFLAMQWLKGASLDELLKTSGPMSTEDVVKIGRQIALGLAAACDHGLIHRDIKPANIWIEPANGGRVKILDFGLARAVTDDTNLTQSGSILGTPAYMAPEQARGDQIDHRCDLFSLGVVLYRMATGELPFRGATTMALLTSLAIDTPTAPNQVEGTVPTELSDLIMQLLEKDPGSRPESGREVADRLDVIGQGLKTNRRPQSNQLPTDDIDELAHPLEKSAIPPGKSRRWWMIACVAGAAALMLLAAVIINIRTTYGTLEVEVNESGARVEVLDKSDTVIIRRDGKDLEPIHVSVVPGKRKIRVKKDGFDVYTSDELEIKEGSNPVLRVTLTPKEPARAVATIESPAKPPHPATAMSPEMQIEALIGQLKELNPGFDGNVKYQMKNGVVREMTISTASVTDISPIKALTGLEILDLSSPDVVGNLFDLTPLKGLNLTSLNLSRTRVTDLWPLREMPLTTLDLSRSAVIDLWPLNGLPLSNLDCRETSVFDISPLRGMSLTRAIFHQTRLSELVPLKGMPLTELGFNSTFVRDLSPLRGMPLKFLECVDTLVSDLSPLEGMDLRVVAFNPERVTRGIEALRKLQNLRSVTCGPDVAAKMTPNDFWTKLDAGGFKVPDAASVQPADSQWFLGVTKMPTAKQVEAVIEKLRELNPGFDPVAEHRVEFDSVVEFKFSSRHVTDISPVRALRDLEILDCSSPDAGPLTSLAPLQAMKLKRISFANTQVSDLSPLAGMPLEAIDCSATQVTHLTPLRGIASLKSVNCGRTFVANISALKEMSLVEFQADETVVSDLTPLRKSKLRTATFTPRHIITGMDVVRRMKSLQTIGSHTAPHDQYDREAFWKKYDAEEFGRLPGWLHSVEFQRWAEEVAAKSPEQQLESVNAKLRERNPGYNERFKAPWWRKQLIENGRVVVVAIIGHQIKDISPIRALADLEAFGFEDAGGQGFTDISPLFGMGLTYLDIQSTDVSNLLPVEGMPLERLNAFRTPIADLTPLRRSHVQGLWMPAALVTDVSPLVGLPFLSQLNVTDSAFSDLTFVKEMPQLKSLWISNTQVSNLTPLEDLQLHELRMNGTPVTDLSPLHKMNLFVFGFHPRNITKGIDIIRRMTSLQKIDPIGFPLHAGMPPDEFWQKFDGGEYR